MTTIVEIIFVHNFIEPVEEILPRFDDKRLLLWSDTNFCGILYDLLIRLFLELHVIFDDIQKEKFAFWILNDVRVVNHIHALKDKCTVKFLGEFLHALELISRELRTQKVLEPHRVVAIWRTLCGNKQIIRLLIIRNQSEESILLDVCCRRELELILKDIHFCFWAFVYTEKFIIRTSNNLLLWNVDVQPSGANRQVVPDAIFKRCAGEIEGRNISVLLFLHELAVAQIHNRIRDALLIHDFLWLSQNLRLFEDMVVQRHKFQFSAWKELCAAELPAKLNATFQVDNIVIRLEWHRLRISVSVNLQNLR